MKKLAIATMIGWSLVLAPLVVSTTGCKTANQSAYKVTATVQVSADFAMRAWGEYVRIKQPGVAAESAVKQAFERYRGSMILVADAGRRFSIAADQDSNAKLDFALAAASSTLADLVNLIQSFGVKLK